MWGKPQRYGVRNSGPKPLEGGHWGPRSPDSLKRLSEKGLKPWISSGTLWASSGKSHDAPGCHDVPRCIELPRHIIPDESQFSRDSLRMARKLRHGSTSFS